MSVCSLKLNQGGGYGRTIITYSVLNLQPSSFFKYHKYLLNKVKKHMLPISIYLSSENLHDRRVAN